MQRRPETANPSDRTQEVVYTGIAFPPSTARSSDRAVFSFYLIFCKHKKTELIFQFFIFLNFYGK